MELDHIAVVKNFLHLKKMNVTNCIRSKAEFLSLSPTLQTMLLLPLGIPWLEQAGATACSMLGIFHHPVPVSKKLL